MKHVLPNKERGVVMILILVFLTMFAIMISAFLFMTSNMSDSAANALALYEKGETAAQRQDSDVDNAIRTLVVGTNNESSPIGPFGILENLYGDRTTMEGFDDLSAVSFNLYAEYDGTTPTKAVVEINLAHKAALYVKQLAEYYQERINRLSSLSGNQPNIRDFLNRLRNEFDKYDRIVPGGLTRPEFLEIIDAVGNRLLDSGSVISFGSLQWTDNADWEGNAAALQYLDMCRSFNDLVSGTSARIIKKEINDDILRLEVALSEELKKFLTLCPRDAGSDPWPINDFAEAVGLYANVRLNPPPFSGTGAGGFAPGALKDGQLTEANKKNAFFPEEGAEPKPDPFRLPFAFWENASAPDLTPHRDLYGNTSFQTFWRHLADRNYSVYTPISEDVIWPIYNGTGWDGSGWDFAADAQVSPHEPTRMNPGYTAVDERNLFLAGEKTVGPNQTTPIPSFVRPETLKALRTLLDAAGEDESPALAALLRKATPRPLRIDHWNWTGSNEAMLASPFGQMTDDPGTIKEKTLAELDELIAAEGEKSWDVDNDNDGVKDGIWIPSGLPIRIDENGKPYATMYSFTVLDLDGRVNLNTAGNWDQMPSSSGEFYTMLGGAISLDIRTIDPNPPWYSYENLADGIGWYDDADDDMETKDRTRSTGLGPAGIDLTAALEAMKIYPEGNDNGIYRNGKVAADILAARYTSVPFGLLNRMNALPESAGVPLFDGLESDWGGVALRGQLAQPSAYYAEPNSAARTDPSQWISDDSDLHRRFYLYTDAVYRGDKTAALADPNLFLFPWRGKTRVFDYGASAGSPQYPKKYSSYPTFDFCDTALRSYDPLGNDILTYMPRFSENPYLVDPYGSSQKDATFTAETLELLLRPFDYDRKNRPAALLSALLKDKTADALDHPEKDEYRALRREITTVSSDIPVPAGAIPVGTAEVKDGVFGLRELIRRCVVLEFYKANRESKFDESYTNQKKAEFADETGLPVVTDEARALFRAYLRGKIEEEIDGFNSGALDAITNQLFALLPRDVREGRRLDLNALSHKACWIDSVYEDQGDGTYVKTLPTGSVDDATREEYEYYHQLGLAERMKFARGLYVLLMALTYEDRNAETVAAFYDNDPEARLADEKAYKNYLEGYDRPYIEKLAAADGSGESTEEKQTRLAAELAANRLAQYCVNLVDFSDPDATMTPFFYDPNPFDGWWSYRDKSADWMYGNHKDVGDGETPPEHQGNDDFFFVLFTDAARDFYDALVPKIGDDGSYSDSFLSTPDKKITPRCVEYLNPALPVKFVNDTEGDDRDTFSQALVSWLNGQSIDNPGVGRDDFGMRLVWGMERPDLLLTETLAFHDLGIADTSNDDSGKTVYGGEDEDFDQVRRPLGSAYLELYCAANPNVPQPPELYEFDKDRNLWKLLLSKMTPRQKADSPYSGKEFPVWRVAITASTDPRTREEQEKELNDETASYKRTIRKKKNSVLERLVGDNADPRTFSFRTRQFCDLTIDDSGEKSLDTSLNDKWRGYDYSVANILGPCAEPNSDGTPDFIDEVEIDRVVWFGWPTKSGSSDKERIDSYPDAAHIFSRVKETEGDNLKTEIFPNQYLVVAPSEKRQIGSLYRGSEYFGVPSPRRIVMTKLRESKSGKWTGSDYILAGTYNGLDINGDDKFEVNKRGLNISEPLWTESTDPYPGTIPTRDITHKFGNENETITITDLDGRNNVPDQIFDLPVNDKKHDRYPVAADHLVGLGTVPGIRSAFVQRVADPNRPYHPFANPYISVDWNMMDLTVFNGEAVGNGENQVDEPFYAGDENEVDQKNHLKVKFLSTDIDTTEFDTDAKNTESVFSSRAWLDPEQKGFLPEDLAKDHRPNPWARPVNAGKQSGELKDVKTAGLRKTGSLSSAYSHLDDLYDDGEFQTSQSSDTPAASQDAVVHIFPKHTLGAYNDAENRVTSLDGQFDGADNADNLRRLYYGAPSRNGSDESFQPFEFLAWNDAPFSSPAELLLVPASAPGRFGLEFIRHKNVKDAEVGDGLPTANLYGEGQEYEEHGKHGKLGRSLGSDGGSGANLFGWEIDSVLTGPYLNFHHTSGVKGESLNLSTLFDYVTIPSLYMGTQTFCGYDENGDPFYTPTLREPGKINLNTMKESAWKGILGGAGKVTEYKSFADSRQHDPFRPGSAAPLRAELGKPDGESGEEKISADAPGAATLLRKGEESENALLDQPENRKNNNLLTATEELRKLAGLTTNRSNVFAVWLTVGYFEVERARPGINMPPCDPDGNQIPVTVDGYLNLTQDYKYSDYYRVIYPDGYTYGKELGTDGVDSDGINRPRAFYLIDRSIPVDFRRGRSWNWKNVILLERKL